MGLWGQAASPETAEAVLRRRLDALGMPPFRGFATHTNRTVLLSVTARGVLRVHRGYAVGARPGALGHRAVRRGPGRGGPPAGARNASS